MKKILINVFSALIYLVGAATLISAALFADGKVEPKYVWIFGMITLIAIIWLSMMEEHND
jgi:hypothetical protein